MSDERKPDWDPRSAEVLRDQRAAYDAMRERCPVAWSDYLQWSLFRHDDVVRVLHDHETFSSAASRHLSVPNGMDPPEHTVYRRLVEPYFAAARVDAFEPSCRQLAADLVGRVLARGEVEFMAEFARPFAVAVQCTFLGWPPALHEPLARWTRKNHEATLARDQAAMADIAREFEGFIDQMLEARRQAGAKPGDDVTAALMDETVGGRPLGDEAIASILRNWTVGEIGTIAAAIGILVEYLSRHEDLRDRLRGRPELLPAAIDEILRIHGPLVANRRAATRAVEIGGRSIAAGERLSLIWISANRDGRVFDDPDAFRLDRDSAANLLYGAGIHVCPGAPLARMELRVAMEELLGHAVGIEPVPGNPATRATYPASGYSTLPLLIR